MVKSSFERLREISHAYRPARMLLTACELDLFDHLEAPAGAAEVARRLRANERAVSILLDGLAALGLIGKQGGRYRNKAAASAYLVSAKPAYRGAIFKHMANCWRGWSELTRTVKTGRSPRDERQIPAQERRSFILGMHAVARDLAPSIARMLPLPETGRLIDVGGGPATYCMAFCRERPKLSCTLLDLPETLRIAKGVLAGEGHDVAGRIRLRGGDFTTDDLGHQAYDFAWLSQVLHAYPEAECAALIAKVFTALKPGGAAAVHEFALSQSKTSPAPAAIFSVHMLAVTAGGRAYSREEIQGWLKQEGFRRIKARKASPASSIIIGWK